MMIVVGGRRVLADCSTWSFALSTDYFAPDSLISPLSSNIDAGLVLIHTEILFPD